MVARLPARSPVQSLSRAVSLLRAIAEAPTGLTLRELSKAVGLAPSTVHRLLTALEAEGLADQEPGTTRWTIGVDAFTIGAAFLAARDLRTLARPYLKRLMEETQETASLYLEADGELVCIDQVECRQLMRATTRVGGRVGMHHTAAGKAILAWREPDQARQILIDQGLAALTPRTLTKVEAVEAQFADIRRQGLGLDLEEHAIGLCCAAAVVFDERGQSVAAVSISGPLARMPLDRLKRMGDVVQAVARDITRVFGGELPAAP